MKKPLFEGCCTALVTPFTKDGAVDYDKLEFLIERQVEAGIAALLLCGTTGEGSTLSEAEHRNIFALAVSAAAGRVPIIANAGCNDTADSVRMAKYAAQAGVDALLAITPYYNKTSQRGLVKHFELLSCAAPLPLLLYSVPSRTGMTIAAETYGQLAQLPQIVGVKEANSDLAAVMENLPLYQSGELWLYSGNDDLALPMMAAGAKGVISVLSNVMPAEMVSLCRLALAGKMKPAAEMQAQLMPYIKALFLEVNPIPVKYAMQLSGICCGGYRLPLCEPAEETKKCMERLVWA